MTYSIKFTKLSLRVRSIFSSFFVFWLGACGRNGKWMMNDTLTRKCKMQNAECKIEVRMFCIGTHRRGDSRIARKGSLREGAVTTGDWRRMRKVIYFYRLKSRDNATRELLPSFGVAEIHLPPGGRLISSSVSLRYSTTRGSQTPRCIPKGYIAKWARIGWVSMQRNNP